MLNLSVLMACATLLACAFILKPSAPPAAPPVDRFAIITGGLAPTIMLDKTNGLVWRNIYCDEFEANGKKKKTPGPPNCWQTMNFNGASPLVSEVFGAEARRNEWSEIETQIKENEKAPSES